MKIYIENQTHDTKDGAHHMPLHTQETKQKRAILCDLVKKSRGGGGMFLPSRGGSQGGHVSSFETGGGGIGMAGPLAWGVHWHGGGGGRCCPAHLNSCPTSTRTIKNPLPWKKKVMWK